MPPLTTGDGKRATSGVTEACLMNDHEMCNNPRCACDCHTKAAEAAAAATDHTPSTPQLEKCCPKCGVKRPSHEAYCRVDGSKLTSLLCSICGAPREQEDKFCWKCGGSTSTPTLTERLVVPSEPTPYTASTSLPTEVPDIGSQIVAQIQRELAAQGGSDGPEEVGEGVPRQVVEQPGGTQGSFKLVSAPNPSRIRVNKPVQPAQAAATPTKIKLPIKPS